MTTRRNKPAASKETGGLFSTTQGREVLYNEWLSHQQETGLLEPGRLYPPNARCAWFASWLRWLVTTGKITPATRLPSYAQFAELPFHLSLHQIATAIRQLRVQGIFPTKKRRKDAGQLRWQQRDTQILRFIGEMHAVRFDQLQRLLVQYSQYQLVADRLSPSRTCEIIDRYERAGFMVYRRVYHHQSGWVYLTRKGLRQVGLTFRADPPSERLLSHLYWINEVRMKLEGTSGVLQWRAERAMQAEQKLKVKGRQLAHIPDGTLILEQADGTRVEIDIEVQVSKPSLREVQDVMGSIWSSGSTNPLWYFVTKQAQGVVRTSYQYMVKHCLPMRPSIQIIDLENWMLS